MFAGHAGRSLRTLGSQTSAPDFFPSTFCIWLHLRHKIQTIIPYSLLFPEALQAELFGVSHGRDLSRYVLSRLGAGRSGRWSRDRLAGDGFVHAGVCVCVCVSV